MNALVEDMVIRTLTVGKLRTHCYIVSDQKESVCAVIDPGAEPMRILDTLDERNLLCKAVLLTHTHPDHAGAVATVCAETKAILYLHPDGERFAKEFAQKLPEASRFVPMLTLPYAAKKVCNQERIKVGQLCFQAFFCPGHTPDGLAFLCGNALFTGDTLFRGTCGRWDLPGGDRKALQKSLLMLSSLPGNPDIYPGHGHQTTLERERQENPALSEISWKKT